MLQIGSSMKICNKCNKPFPDLDWDRDLQKKTGVWKLAHITKNSDGSIIVIPHNCDGQAQPNFNAPYDQCTDCEGFLGWFRTKDEMNNHRMIYHEMKINT